QMLQWIVNQRGRSRVRAELPRTHRRRLQHQSRRATGRPHCRVVRRRHLCEPRLYNDALRREWTVRTYCYRETVGLRCGRAGKLAICRVWRWDAASCSWNIPAAVAVRTRKARPKTVKLSEDTSRVSATVEAISR